MAPSEPTPGEAPGPTKPPPPASHAQPPSQEQTSKDAAGKPEPNGTPIPLDGTSEVKLSGAELKKRAKAEKAARREKEKQAAGAAGLPQGAQGKKNDNQAPAAKQNNAKGPGHPPKEDGKIQHKRTGSTANLLQHTLPTRPAKAHASGELTSKPKTAKDSKHVALFGHLYGQSRRTSLTGVSKDVHPAVLALGLQMSHYVVCGSNARCVASLMAFKRVIESYVTPPGTTLTRHLTSHLSPQIDYLKSCRPLSVSMGNAIRWLKLEISKVDIDTPEAEAKEDLCDAIDNFIREKITVADQVIASSAGEKIRNGDVILTYSKSSIVQQTLVEAYNRGVKFRVIVVDSKPLFEGKYMARALANLGLEVQYSLIHGVSHAIKEASKCFLGAHAMMSNGRLYSRAGTAIVAMMASESDIPVIVCCESVKFTEKVALDSIVNNEVAPPDELISPTNLPPSSVAVTAGGSAADEAADEEKTPSLSSWRDTPNLQLLNLMYDVTPAEFIKMVITEYGSLPPSSVPVVHRLSTNS